jgi:hypothetical protein
MVPYYATRHLRQIVGLEGPDLAGQRRRELLADAIKNIHSDSIQQFDDKSFHVASNSRPGQFHAINLDQGTCGCEDFPRAQFCRHIAAIEVHFPHLFPEEVDPIPLITQPSERSDLPQHVTRSEIILTLTEEISALAQSLTSEPIHPLALAPRSVVEAYQSAKHGLNAFSAAIAGSSAFPKKTVIAPNQKSWPETAEQMGVKRNPKRKRLPEERGLSEQSIGTAKGKRRRVHDDPYAAGERSGKGAKPDARSAAANTRARELPLPSERITSERNGSPPSAYP